MVPPRRQPSAGAPRRPSQCTVAPVATAGGPSQSSGATALSVTPLVAAPAPSAPPAAVCRAGRGRTSAGVRLAPVPVRFLRAGACVSPPQPRFLPLLLSHKLRRTNRRRSRSPACKRGTPTCLRQRYLLHTPLIDECAEYSRPQPGPGQLAARKTLAKHARMRRGRSGGLGDVTSCVRALLQRYCTVRQLQLLRSTPGAALAFQS